MQAAPRRESVLAMTAEGFEAELQARAGGARVGLYPIVTLQYSSTTLYQVSYHIR
jgi:hypothetical protein